MKLKLIPAKVFKSCNSLDYSSTLPLSNLISWNSNNVLRRNQLSSTMKFSWIDMREHREEQVVQSLLAARQIFSCYWDIRAQTFFLRWYKVLSTESRIWKLILQAQLTQTIEE